MSQYWFYHCKTCDKSSEQVNHGKEVLLKIVDHADCFVCLTDHFDVSIDIYEGYGSGSAVSFMVEHRSHELEIACEYEGSDKKYDPVPVKVRE